MRISAVVVTKGDRDISPIVEFLKHPNIFDEIVVWDNKIIQENNKWLINGSVIKDLKVYGRYFAAATIARNEHIYIQDDDCDVPVISLIAEYERLAATRPNTVLCNFPMHRRAEYRGSMISLLGWGTLFHKSHLSVFNHYFETQPFDDLFLRECDRVFSYLNYRSTALTDVGVRQLPYAFGEDRMGRETRHGDDLKEIKRRLCTL